ncbi:ATP-grasp peptide maturase system methyltransferase [Kitasatospora sp. NPDC086801]|uniref:ATP-grasp peptide maturase system methyltransferase n=1 Tax=Streptomycetaceae TaxID=2062 RepID=UPI002E7857BA|nr:MULTISPECIES: ATP-grasp peptide maturase system methyltransferase [unclassified Streptomyces]MED7951060.1 ATP-grasp peptide maturase system methyltransferase [Streptomyces sp. BE303]MEE1821526.1 ATP-grasp peptide maturase system methyltransferase [Streptomyces sp. BE20]
MSTSAELRAALVDGFTGDDMVTDPAWNRAAKSVPRELFVGSYFLPVEGTAPTEYRPVQEGEPGWLAGVYTNQTLITQLDGRIRPEDGTASGSPSSSSTLPSLVLRMWHQLDTEAGHQVLEIGTGTGYSTALGAYRLGDANITSIEYDQAVGEAAAAALKSAGHAPRLIIGDGLLGDPDGGEYDRLIATCSVRYIPQPWLYQVKPGGKILVTLSGWSYGFGLALLTVTEPGSATGRFLPGWTSFMIARPHDRPPRQSLALLPGDERPSRIDPEIISTWTGGWVAQLAAPSAERMGAGGQQILSDVATGSQARTMPNPDGGWTVIQRGPLRLWDQVESAVEAWQAAGEPHQDGFGITVSPLGQRVWIGSEAGPGWNLPI